MDHDPEKSQPGNHLANISTMWTVLRAAHAEHSNEAADAQRLLLHRYGGAVYRYLLSAVRDPHVADDLTQEFALRLIQGNFRHASPERGRFRSYIKTVLFHMVSEHRRRATRQRTTGSLEVEVAAPAEHGLADDEQFLASWRDELLARVWSALEASNAEYYRVLRYKAEHPASPSEEIAAEWSAKEGRVVTAVNVRQILRRARDRFSRLLIEEIASSLQQPTDDAINDELIELGLMQYCRRPS